MHLVAISFEPLKIMPLYVGTGARFISDHASVRANEWRLIPFNGFSTSATDGQTDGQTTLR